MSFDTGYIGAHRWAVNEERSFKWTCVCGDHGNVASLNRDSVLLAFADHAHRKVEKAAVALLVDWMPSSLPTSTIEAVIGQLREQERPDNDKANLLQLVVNDRWYQEQEQQSHGDRG